MTKMKKVNPFLEYSIVEAVIYNQTNYSHTIMPKEVTHWIIADKVTAALQDSRYASALNAHPNIVRFGAVFHDKLYYWKSKNHPKDGQLARAIKYTANRMHGIHGEDSLDIIRGMLRWIQEHPNTNEHLIALMTGLVTHIFTDIVWHPMVYYYTGDYNDPDEKKRARAQREHLQLEAAFDIYFCNKSISYLLDNYGLDQHIQGLEYDLKELLRHAFRYFTKLPLQTLVDHYAQAVEDAIDGHRLIRNYKMNTWAQYAMPVVPHSTWAQAGALYHDGLLEYMPRLSKGLNYKNPVTGEAEKISMEALMQKAVDACVDFLKDIEDRVFDGSGEWNFPNQGRSLEHAQLPGKRYQMRYFERFFE